MSRVRPAAVAGTLLAGAGLAAAAVAVAHASPALAAITPLRRRLLPNLAGVGDPKHVALTFDDGPDPRSTPAFLKALDAHGVHATFFLLGSMLARTRSLGRDLVAAGHEIAVHGWHHEMLLTRGPRATYTDLARTRDLIAEVTGEIPRWYRPPYGVLTAPAVHAAHRLDLTPVLWTTWGRDWSVRATHASILDTVTRNLDGGGTVLLHDSDCTSAPGSWRATLAALPDLVGLIHDRGLAVGPLREHAVPVGALREGASAL
jgi:peptidoglycan/xylan/chitin deacetylase (PgdA/CDA1 family)